MQIRVNRKLIIYLLTFLLFSAIYLSSAKDAYVSEDELTFWDVQAVDTMKYSRDLAREKTDDITFNREIKEQVELIAQTNATHIAVGTPYDAEFTLFLQKWVNEARRNNLNVWFRGNFSGWENWFEYESINRAQHLQRLNAFILNNPKLFEDGDIFTTCTECENGGPGDPRSTGDVDGFRNFLIDEHNVASEAFDKIDKKVATNYFSMNGDVANLVMDKETTSALDAIVVIDHYVSTPEKLALDINRLAEKSGGKIVLGEFGAPIPDIHGDMSEEEQAEWIQKALEEISKEQSLIGINYWLLKGGGTALVYDQDEPKEAIDIVSQFYKPTILSGVITDSIGNPVKDAIIMSDRGESKSDASGRFTLPIVSFEDELVISAERFETNITTASNSEIVLHRADNSLSYAIIGLITKLFSNLKSLGI